MPARNASTEPTSRPMRSNLARTKLDWAIIVSLLAMGAFNLLVMADKFGTTAAHAAAPICGIPLA
ncbi:hypothetical protein [Novosphingobium mangrovi (ex Huang et al. 2023)]|uniref:MFS transporter n=1 Tax=Novosphingobium mangrovi (ex Huang et al. 2023) TaxID=2976432 RepID=A0ABT2I221_9SPHN|nr:hypothetical protein [Novosphingobium mangrovi (ex Huang et al. 2023)]MCT2398850.1 hypothetical protein [Novosphingobium mangrovi (ex Huang et al. 2023)]